MEQKVTVKASLLNKKKKKKKKNWNKKRKKEKGFKLSLFEIPEE
jgi:hypothetical protein